MQRQVTDNRGGPTCAMSEIVDIPVPQTVKEKTVEVVKVIPQGRVSERTVEQIVNVPAEIPRARVGPHDPKRGEDREGCTGPVHSGDCGAVPVPQEMTQRRCVPVPT